MTTRAVRPTGRGFLLFDSHPTGCARIVATAQLALKAGTHMEFVSADYYADTIKTEVMDMIAQQFGPVDYLIYSVA